MIFKLVLLSERSSYWFQIFNLVFLFLDFFFGLGAGGGAVDRGDDGGHQDHLDDLGGDGKLLPDAEVVVDSEDGRAADDFIQPGA